MTEFVIAIDQGTTSSRAVLVDRQGRRHAVGQVEFPQYFPRPGWVEHDPEEIWSSQQEALRQVMAAGAVTAEKVAALGITNQRETTVVWERATGRPIHPAIVWQDRRTAELCARLRAEGHEALVRRRTGLPLDPYFSGTKLRWILDQVPGARARAEAGELAFGTIDSWLVHRLSDGALHVTDVSNASRTLLFDLETLAWDDELLELLRIPRAVLPEVHSSAERLGEVRLPGELRGVPIAALIGDQQSATLGQGCWEPGQGKCTYGTGCFLLLNTGEELVHSRENLISTVGWRVDGRTRYALEGSVFVGGAVVQWLRDGLGLIENAADVEALAGQVEDSGGVRLVPAFVGLGAPHWDADARGTVLGITRGTTAAHLARAALDSIASQVTDLVAAMERDLGREIPELRVDSGATRNDLLMQIQADLLQKPILRAADPEVTARGAAILAWRALGHEVEAPDTNSLARFEPRMSAERAAEHRRGWAAAVERSKGWAREAGVEPQSES